jgi:hypothetical protein
MDELLQPDLAGTAFWVLLILSAVMSYVGARMATQEMKPDAPLRDRSKPTTLSDRGSYIQYVIGRRRIGPVFGWAGQRWIVARAKSTGATGGKGGGGESSVYVDFYHERGVHWLCVGPAYRLNRIWKNGKQILSRPISRDSHPSGTSITVGPNTFEIYWGEENQPVNTYLGASGRMGVTSRWPGVCYILWKDMALGQQAVWPQMEYDIEVVPQDADLSTLTGAIRYGNGVLTGSAYSINGSGLGTGGAGYFRITQAGGASLRKRFHPGRRIQIVGNSYAGGGPADLTVFKSTYNSVTGNTRVYVYENIGVANSAGTLQTYERTIADDGVSMAHAIDYMLTAEWPKGLGIDPTDAITDFQTSTWSELKDLFDDEDIPGSFIVKDGEEAGAVLGRLFHDLGLFLSWNSQLGQWWIYPVREETTIPTIPNNAILRVPKHAVNHGGVVSASRVDYTFTDRERKYKDTTIEVANDAEWELRSHPKTRRHDLMTAIGIKIAARIAERRALEDINDTAGYEIKTGRETRFMVPGQVFKTDQTGTLQLRLTEVGINTNNNEVRLRALVDTYGLEKPTYETGQGGGLEDDNNDDYVEEDLAQGASETEGGGPGGSPAGGGSGGGGPPGYTGPNTSGEDGGATGAPAGVIFNRIRANTTSGQAGIYVSRDDITYTFVGTTSNYQTGGPLRDAIGAGESSPITGKEFDILGPDIGIVEDLSGDTARLNSGHQLVFINDEIFFLESITIDGSGTYATLDKMYRAKYNTAAAAHSISDNIFIVPFDRLTVISDPLMDPGTTMYIKVVPTSTADGTDSVDLESVTAISLTFNGNGCWLFRENTGEMWSSGDGATWDRIPGQAAYLDPSTATTNQIVTALQASGAIDDTP